MIYRCSRSVLVGIIFVLFITSGCETVSKFNEHAYGLQTSWLADVRQLLDAANTSYDQNTDQIRAVTLNMERAYQFDRGRNLNQIQVAQWRLMRAIYYRTLVLWKSEGTLRPAYITEKKLQMAMAMDQITQFEAAKIH